MKKILFAAIFILGISVICTIVHAVPGTSVSENKMEGAPKEAPQNPPNMRFGIASGELISVDDKGPDNIIVKVKTRDGKELTATAASYLTIMKTVKIADLKKGEKVTVHYMTGMENNANTIIHISTGDIPEVVMPPEIELLQKTGGVPASSEREETKSGKR